MVSSCELAVNEAVQPSRAEGSLCDHFVLNVPDLPPQWMLLSDRRSREHVREEPLEAQRVR
jgi:hypothetical protein